MDRRDARGLRRADRRAADRDERARAPAAPAGPGRRSRCAPTSTRCRSTRRAASSSPPSAPARCTPAGTTGTPRCCSARRASWRARELPGGELRFIFQHARGARARRRARHGRRGRDGGRGLRLRLPSVDAAGVRQGRRGAGAVHGRRGLLQAHDHRPRRARRPPPHRDRHGRGRRGAGRQPAAHRLAPDRSAAARGGHDRQHPRRRCAERDPRRGRPDGHDALVRPGRARADPEADRGDRRGGLRGARRLPRAGLPVRLQARRQRGARDGARARGDRATSSSSSTRSWAATTSRPSRPRRPGATPSSAPAASTRTITRASGSTSGRSPPGRGSTSRSPRRALEEFA